MRLGMITTLAATTWFAGLARAAEEVAGIPIPAGTGFQRGVTPVAHSIQWLDNFLLVIITVITLFVVGLMAWVCFRYNEKANPEPARFTHNALIEVIWTAVPVVILVIIAIPSLKLLFLQLDIPESDVVIKATGNQWFWSYEYPDEEVSFDAFMIGGGYTSWDTFANDEANKNQIEEYGMTPDNWLLQTDTHVVVPVGKNVHMLITGSDVIHAWTIPSFGAKIDAVPGRINELWFRAEETGVFYGQCSELCGKDHAYMPITVEVVSEDAYAAWVSQQQAKARGETEVALATQAATPTTPPVAAE